MSDPYQQIIEALSKCRRVLITTHVRPDGDALGTTAALSMALRKQNIDSQVLLLSHIPSKYKFVYQDNGVNHIDVENGWKDPFPFSEFDALLVADTGTWSQLPGLRERIASWDAPKIVLDHHLTQEDWADLKLVIPEAAAAGEIAAELLEQWEIPLDKQIATALYLAIASDTGWFQFSNTRPFTMRLAATLMEAGVNTDEMYQHLYQSERPERVALQTRAMQSLELLADNRLAVMTVTKQDFADTGAGVPATENLINIPLQIATIEAALLFVDPPDGPGGGGPIRVSLRSKGQIDVSKFAEQFGGGGHARAAGLKLDGPLADAEARIKGAMLQALR
ncbi:MAG: DHH family phosphoesterase [Anaerolineae bacterium]|nr:DHH family phosphoesterase [Phycisphaerae bacterium]